MACSIRRKHIDNFTFTFTFNILVLFFHLCLGLPGGLFPPGFPTKMLWFCHPPMRSTCLAHLIIVDVTSLVTIVEVCKLWSSSSCHAHSYPLH
jgi:hypothetical protein